MTCMYFSSHFPLVMIFSWEDIIVKKEGGPDEARVRLRIEWMKQSKGKEENYRNSCKEKGAQKSAFESISRTTRILSIRSSVSSSSTHCFWFWIQQLPWVSHGVAEEETITFKTHRLHSHLPLTITIPNPITPPLRRHRRATSSLPQPLTPRTATTMPLLLRWLHRHSHHRRRPIPSPSITPTRVHIPTTPIPSPITFTTNLSTTLSLARGLAQLAPLPPLLRPMSITRPRRR